MPHKMAPDTWTTTVLSIACSACRSGTMWRQARPRRFPISPSPLAITCGGKKTTKLMLTASMVCLVMPTHPGQKDALSPCDSWYTKKDFPYLASEFFGLDIICGTRADTTLYSLSPARMGKRGQPAQRRLVTTTPVAKQAISSLLLLCQSWPM